MRVEIIEVEDIKILDDLIEENNKVLMEAKASNDINAMQLVADLDSKNKALNKVLTYVRKKTRNKKCVHCGKYFKAKDYRTRYCSECKNKNYNVEALKKSVTQYDLENNIVEVYESVRQASRETGISKSCISAVATGKRKSTKRIYLEV